MPNHFDKRLNEIFETFERVRQARVIGDVALENKKITDGLAASCLFLRDLQTDPVFGNLNRSPEALAVLKRLHEKGRFKEFLKMERQMLELTKLKAEFLDFVFCGLERIVLTPEPPEDWRDQFNEFTQTVCDAAKSAARLPGRRKLLKRAIFAGGGALISIFNNAPPPNLPIPHPIIQQSTILGVWLLSKAADKQADNYLDNL